MPGRTCPGAIVYVTGGTANHTTYWFATNTTPPIMGTTDILFSRFVVSGDFVSIRDGGMEEISTIAAAGSTETIDLGDGNVHDVTLTDDCTFTFTGATAGVACSFTLLLRQDGTGGWDATWPGSVVWPGGGAPTLDTTASSASVLTFFTLDGGTVWFGFAVGGGSAAAAALDDLTDVTITAATDGDVLTYDGAGWVNETPVISEGGQLLISDTPSTPLVFADIIQNEAQDDFLYAG